MEHRDQGVMTNDTEVEPAQPSSSTPEELSPEVLVVRSTKEREIVITKESGWVHFVEGALRGVQRVFRKTKDFVASAADSIAKFFTED